MFKILLSINPEHIGNIFKWTKKYEFRKVVCVNNVDTIIFYATYPIKRIVGESNAVTILVDSPDIICGVANNTQEYQRHFLTITTLKKKRQWPFRFIKFWNTNCLKS